MLSRSNFCILFLILVFGFTLCFTNGFADNTSTAALEDSAAIPEGSFDFPTAEGAGYIQGTPEFQRGLDSIFGTPDFEKVRDLPTNSRDYILGRKVGMIAVPQRFNPDRSWICTGFLVGPDLFLTNHHCIHDDFGLLPLADARIFMDYLQERSDDPTLGGVTAGVLEILRMDEPKDYALLRLDKPIGDTYGWLELDTTTRVNPVGESVKLISHNAVRSKEIVRRNSEVVAIPPDHSLTSFPFPIAYLADTEGGSSGSPVFLREGTIVVGINHSSWFRSGIPDFNAGSLMSYIVPEIEQWLPEGPPTPPTPPTDTVQMYWTDVGTRKIQRANLDGSQIEDLVAIGLEEPTGIAVDVSGGKMYWTDAGTRRIQRANLDGSQIEDLVAIGLLDPEGITLDVDARKVYWADSNKIQRANLDGSQIEDLVTQSIDTEDVALDIGARKMYWTDWEANKIQRANLDGTNVEDIVTGLNAPVDIELDIGARKMYWTDWEANKIQRANLDGTNVEDIVTTGSEPNGLALNIDASQMYWIEQGTSKIRRANLNGANVEDLVVTGLQLPYGIVLGIPQTTPTPPEPPIPPEPSAPVDVNGDGEVTVIDLAIVALFYGTEVPFGISLPADVNGDGIVDLLDLTLVAQAIDAAGGGANGLSLDALEAALEAVAEEAAGVEDAAEAPMGFDTRQDILSDGIAYRNVAAALTDARLEKGIPAVLKQLLQLLREMRGIPETTALLPNYPNPFNPETWMPYHLAKPADVSLTIYDARGAAVRALTLGHQAAGIYESRTRAAYWDGRNASGESVASGVYFYTLTAGEFTATRKLLIIK